MTIIQQCANCSKEGKNFYCSNCTKSADYFDVYKYEDNNNRISKGKMIGRIKAYTWHDAIEYVKNSLFHDRTKKFNINCEKDFAYVEEEDIDSIITGARNKEKETMLGFKLYLNKEEEEKSESSFKGQNFWDLTITITNNNITTDIPNISNNEQQQTVASAIEPNPRNQLTAYTPTMITRSAKEQKQEKEEEEENTLADKS
jgi:hypothetical protein